MISYKISEKAETRISFDGYSEYLLVGKYIGGEYCCVSKGENSFFDVLLIKNGNIEKTYHHIFNPKTGYPVETSVVSLTIVSKQSIDGEIWTTRLFGQTPQQILTTVATLPDISAIVITNTGEMLYSPELKKYIA